jgi:hypothetical protein
MKVLDKPWLDFAISMARSILASHSGLADGEREKLATRVNEGRKTDEARGVSLEGKLNLQITKGILCCGELLSMTVAKQLPWERKYSIL